ncbi:hypothetical protein AT728_26565 [Streptomyces silvensis]|uniref:Uncharacterized protein n=1 Tax=Streptomyces silvensis TaxID=1765722 RepID=A0A0W7WWR3_9ACTN|nr:hypothetical protein AT728_26565 [Streptomyces silvensis]
MSFTGAGLGFGFGFGSSFVVLVQLAEMVVPALASLSEGLLPPRGAALSQSCFGEVYAGAGSFACLVVAARGGDCSAGGHEVVGQALLDAVGHAGVGGPPASALDDEEMAVFGELHVFCRHEAIMACRERETTRVGVRSREVSPESTA